MLRAVVLTQYRRVTDRRTDGQTDGIAVANTALAMRALRRAAKPTVLSLLVSQQDGFSAARQNVSLRVANIYGPVVE